MLFLNQDDFGRFIWDVHWTPVRIVACGTLGIIGASRRQGS